MKPILKFVKSTLLGGFLFLIPIVLLIVILTKAHDLMLKIAQPLSTFIPLEKIGGVAMANILVILLLLLACFLAGLLATRSRFRAIQGYIEEKILGPLPGYRVVKAFFNSLELYESREEKLLPVIVELDRHRRMGFEMERSGREDVVVYLPGAPNFITGQVVIVPSQQVRRLEVPLKKVTDSLEQFGFGTTELLHGGTK